MNRPNTKSKITTIGAKAMVNDATRQIFLSARVGYVKFHARQWRAPKVKPKMRKIREKEMALPDCVFGE
jgi:hypothetical protein